LEPWEKVLVNKEFFGTEHGEIDCQDCHGGNPEGGGREDAHQDIVKDPTIKTAEKVCGECHEEIVETGTKSLHATLSTFSVILKSRSSEKTWEGVDTGRKNHCAGCHSSCGQCHVSRPKFAKSGFLNGHLFQRKPSMVNQCTACHGSRVGDEYYGNRGIGDLHLAQGGMDCMECHGAEEMHASGEGLAGRYHLPEMPGCTDCHEGLKQGDVKQHQTHVGKVQCQICHSQDYVNCYSCHVGKDDQGLAYFQNEKEVETFKIGKAYPGSGSEEKFIVVRHEPSDLEVFDHYIKDGFPNFDKVPTWKRASPHNIQRKTWRNQNCNHCHGQRDLFLSEADLLDYEKGANAPVVVPDAEVPKARKGIPADVAVNVMSDMLVTAEELHGLLAGRKVVLVDARAKKAFKAGHIEGAVHFDAVREVRYPPGDLKVMTLRSPDELAEKMGAVGIDGNERVVIYDGGSMRGSLLFMALERIGHGKVALLDGGLEGWEEAGYHTVAGDPPAVESKVFKARPNDSVMAGNKELAAALERDDAVVLDVRSIADHIGLLKHGLAEKAGRIDGTVNFSFRAFWSVEGFMKDPAAVTWLLESRGITKDKTVITTCNTSQFAAGATFALQYLGYKKVKTHDGSYVNWEKAKKSAASGEKAPEKAKEDDQDDEDKFGC
jgi:thiosulfate/3-mercaptopyruvate sulfurtransferase